MLPNSGKIIGEKLSSQEENRLLQRNSKDSRPIYQRIEGLIGIIRMLTVYGIHFSLIGNPYILNCICEDTYGILIFIQNSLKKGIKANMEKGTNGYTCFRRCVIFL